MSKKPPRFSKTRFPAGFTLRVSRLKDKHFQTLRRESLGYEGRNQSSGSKVKRWYSDSQGGPAAIHMTLSVKSMMTEALVCH